MKYDLTSIYKRYSSKELLLKFIVTKLLSFKLTRTPSFYFLKKLLSLGQGRIFHLAKNIYFAGETIHEAIKTSEQLANTGIASILDYAVEGQNDEVSFDNAMKNTHQLIDMSYKSKKSMPFVVIKPSSLGSTTVYKIMSENSEGNIHMIDNWTRIIERFRNIFDHAQSLGVSVMIDAEQTAIQPAIDRLMITMMADYNRHYPVIMLTMQFYLKDKLKTLDGYYTMACNDDFILGVKIVRGAYLEEEKRQSAPALYFESKKDTDDSYNTCIDYISNRLDRIYPFFATHNYESLIRIMKNDNLSSTKIWVGQLYGLGDHLTFSLKNIGLRTCKYLPYGPPEKSVPYLLRRIEENAISTETFKNECELLFKELINRLLSRKNELL